MRVPELRSAAPCLVCGATDAALRFVQRGYPVYRCASCGLQFVSPIPSAAELAEYYDRSYSVPLERYAAAGVRNARRIADVERWCPDCGRLLELERAKPLTAPLVEPLESRGWGDELLVYARKR